MSRPCCVTCGRPFAVVKPAKLAKPVDTAELSDKALYAAYRKSAPEEDLRFFLRYAVLSFELRTAAGALLVQGCKESGGQLARTDFYIALRALQDRWRKADDWRLVVVPRERLARRRAKAAKRTAGLRDAA